MASTTASNAANVAGPTAVLTAAEAHSFAPSITHRFARAVPINRGEAAAKLPRWGARRTAGTRAETTAVTVNPINTLPSPTTLTPAPYGLAIGTNDDAEVLTSEENSVKAHADKDLLFANARYIDCDTSIGLAAYHFGQLSNSSGRTTTRLKRSTFADAAVSIHDRTFSPDIDLVAIIEHNMRAHLSYEGHTSSASSLAGAARQDYVRALFGKRLWAGGEDRGGVPGSYLWSYDDMRLHVFVTPSTDECLDDGTDVHGAVFVPDMERVGMGVDTRGVQPCFGYCYRTDPAPASVEGMVRMTRVELSSGVHIVASRSFAGIRELVRDVISAAGTGILYDSAGQELIAQASP